MHVHCMYNKTTYIYIYNFMVNKIQFHRTGILYLLTPNNLVLIIFIGTKVDLDIIIAKRVTTTKNITFSKEGIESVRTHLNFEIYSVRLLVSMTVGLI